MWHFSLIRSDTGAVLNDLNDAVDRRISFKLNQPTEFTFKVAGTSETARALGTLTTDIYIAWDALLLARCRVGSTTDSLDENDHQVDVSALDYVALLDRRYAHQAISYTAQDLTFIAWDLIDYTQRRDPAPAGDWGITRGLTAVTANVNFAVADGKKVGEAIADVRNTFPEFDYEIDGALKFNCWAMRGTQRDFALEYGGNVSQITRTVDTANYANRVRQSGADGLAPAVRQASDLATRPEKRIEAQEGNTDLANTALIGWAADAYLQRHGTLYATYTCKLNPAAGWDPTQLWLGDRAWVVIDSGRLAVQTLERVFQIDVEVGNDGQTDTSVSFGDFQEDILAMFHAVPASLEQINRR